MTDAELTVTVHGVSYVLKPGDEFTFGRATDCTVCLDQDDVGISRLAGSLAYNGAWWLHNCSARRPLVVVNHVRLRNVLAPALRHAVEGQVRVLVEGSRGTHHLELAGPPPAQPRAAEQQA